MKTSLYKTTVLFISIFTFILNPILVMPLHANTSAELQQSGSRGQTFGNTLTSGFSMPTIDGSGQVDFGSASTFPNGTLDLNNLFADEDNRTSINDLQNANTDDAIVNAGTVSSQHLSTGATSSGRAYITADSIFNSPAPDLENDPMFGLTDSIVSQLGIFENDFSDCTTTAHISPTTSSVHIPDLKQCEKYVTTGGSCEIDHIIEIEAGKLDIAFLIDTTSSMDSAINELKTNVIDFANLLTGSNVGGDVRMAGVDFSDDNYTQIGGRFKFSNDIPKFESWVGTLTTNGDDENVFSAITWANSNLSWRPDAKKVFIIIGNDEAYGNRSAAISAINSKNIQTYVFHNVDTVKTIGHHLADEFDGPSLFNVAEFLVIVKDTWLPDSCIQDAQSSVSNGLCSGHLAPEPAVPGTCENISGFNVCEGQPIYNQISDAPVPGISKLTTKIVVGEMSCNVTAGPPTTTPGDTCGVYENDNQCAFVKQECVEDSRDDYGRCLVFNQTFDCGYSNQVGTATVTNNVSCSGSISCMGTDCVTPPNEQSQDFAKAAAALQTLDFINKEMQCDGGGQNCQVFKGEASTCKKALGGWVDCCETPKGVSLTDYIQLIFAAKKVDSFIVSSNSMAAIQGSWSVLRQPFASTWETVSNGFSTSMDALTGTTTSVSNGAASQSFLDTFKQNLLNHTADFIAQSFGPEVAGLLFQSAGGGALEYTATGAIEGSVEIGGAIGGPLQFMMTAYMIYSIVNLIVNLIWKCDEDEFELGAKRQLKSCHYVGSYCHKKFLGCVEKRETYCCYSSPIGRIIQEEVAAQGYSSFGTAKNPICAGLTINELNSINWDTIDLSEWIGILNEAGIIPDQSPIPGRTYVSDPQAVVIQSASTRGDNPEVVPTEEDVAAKSDATDLRFQTLSIAFSHMQNIIYQITSFNRPYVPTPGEDRSITASAYLAIYQEHKTGMSFYSLTPEEVVDYQYALDIFKGSYDPYVTSETEYTAIAKDRNDAVVASWDTIPSTAYTLADQKYSSDGLTGSGSALNGVGGESRPDIITRTLDKANGLDVNETRDDARDELWTNPAQN